MSNKVIAFKQENRSKDKCKFIKDIVKIERPHAKTGEIVVDHHVVIKLKNLETGKGRIHPYTDFLNRWKNKSTKHRVNMAGYLVQFLNYIYFELSERALPDISELDFEIGIDFLNDYNERCAKSTASQMESVLSQFYYFLAEKGLLKHIKKSDFQFIESNNRLVMLSPFKGKVKQNQAVTNTKLHHIDQSLIIPFLQTALNTAPSIALGVYFQIFGGLRASEVISVEYSDISLKGPKGRDGMLIELRKKDLRPDTKTGFINGVKKQRKQRVIGMNGMLTEIFELHKKQFKQDEHLAVFVNRDGLPMDYKTYNRRFNKVKRVFIEKLKQSENPELKSYALTLQSYDWSTHIGRGIFSNMCSEVAANAVELASMRGDSTLDASLIYVTDNDKMATKLNTLMNEFYKEFNEALELEV